MHSVVQKEIENFAKDSSRWWDEKGPFAPLHRMNPTRLSFIKDQICAHFGRDVKGLRSYEGLSILDIGCGGGLVCEPMARLGGTATGVDADTSAIDAARAHTKQGGLDIRYIAGSSETLLENRDAFDVVLALEIIEHVADPEQFVRHCADLCKPGGMVIFSTLNRTAKSFALGKVAAEYILGWVPRGTHDWKKFVKPSELARHARMAGLSPASIEGIVFDPFKAEFRRDRNNVSVNYLMATVKGGDIPEAGYSPT